MPDNTEAPNKVTEPCPHCYVHTDGRSRILRDRLGLNHPYYLYERRVCSNCGFSSVARLTGEEAAKAWDETSRKLRGITLPRTYDGDIEALAPMLPDGWVAMQPSEELVFWYSNGLAPEIVYDTHWGLNYAIRIPTLKISDPSDWRTSLRRIQSGKVVPV